MSRLTPRDAALRTLAGEQLPRRCRMETGAAVDWLRDVTGQDFGVDVVAWREWLRAHPVDGFGNPRESQPGVLLRTGGGFICDVRLDDGREIEATMSAAQARQLCLVSPGIRVHVRVAPFGCSRVIRVDNTT